MEEIREKTKELIELLDNAIDGLQKNKMKLIKENEHTESNSVKIIKKLIESSNEFITNDEILFFLQQVEPKFELLTLHGVGRLMARSGFIRGSKENKRGWYCEFDDSDFYAEK